MAALAEFVTELIIESVLLEALIESLNAARVEALCGKNTLTTTETTASNVLGPIPALPSRPPVSTNSPSTTS